MQIVRRRDGESFVLEAFSRDQRVLEPLRRQWKGAFIQWERDGVPVIGDSGGIVSSGPAYVLWRPEAVASPGGELEDLADLLAPPLEAPILDEPAPPVASAGAEPTLTPSAATHPPRPIPGAAAQPSPPDGHARQAAPGRTAAARPPAARPPAPAAAPLEVAPIVVAPLPTGTASTRARPRRPSSLQAALPRAEAAQPPQPAEPAPPQRFYTPHKNITRVDYPPKSTYGYMVRVRWKGVHHQRFFSDRVHGGRIHALEAAIAWRNAKEHEIGKPRSEALVIGKGKSNTGILGVTRTTAGGNPVFQVTWYEDGRQRRKKFNIRRLGEELALRQAADARAAAEAGRLSRRLD